MYLGHYGIGLALKEPVKGLSLGWLFLATQFVDILATIFAILEIEKANVRFLNNLLYITSFSLSHFITFYVPNIVYTLIVSYFNNKPVMMEKVLY